MNPLDLVPSVQRAQGVTVDVAASAPSGATAIGIPVAAGGAVPDELGIARAALAAAGFDGDVGQALALPGTGPAIHVAFGVGDPTELDAPRLRDAAAAFSQAVSGHVALTVTLPGLHRLSPRAASAAIVEGIRLARYGYDPLKSTPSGPTLVRLTLVVSDADHEGAAAGARDGVALADATQLARDLANAPPGHLTATRLAEIAAALGPDRGLAVEIFDGDALAELGCGGLLGVNAGSVEPPRMVKLIYAPRMPDGSAADPAGRLTFVGKGIMYDSGGISLKPSDPVHATMKTDMAGAGAVLGAMSALSSLACRTCVTAYLMCAENMPSGSALRLGDVLTIYGGTTVEVLNTDAEGRLVMADALVLATEEPVDAIIDIATLTGACLKALGKELAGVFGNDQSLVEQLLAAARNTDEQLWQLPLDKRYRKQLDSGVADIANLGGPEPGAITAALFLAEFVDGVPWAHVDIAGTAYNDDARPWRPKGATGFGARLLIDTALHFAAPVKDPSTKVEP